MTPAERQRIARLWARIEGREDTTQRGKAGHRAASRARVGRWRPPPAPFVGVDGEGGGTDDKGRQLYLLFRIGPAELYTGRRLRTGELLEFICDQPASSDQTMVGFGIGYDATMILRDLPVIAQKRLLTPIKHGEGRSPYTWFGDFGIEYRPTQYLRVCRTRKIEDAETGRKSTRVIEGSSRTIFETFGAFRKGFVAALADWELATPAELAVLAATKAKRNTFEEVTPEIRAYCGEEVERLAELMERVRRDCHAAGIRPRQWTGFGQMAEALHRANKTPRREALAELIPPEVIAKATEAYYGGRMEIPVIGKTEGPIHAYDQRSSFAAQLPGLPCLLHGAWERLQPRDLSQPANLYVADVSFGPPRIKRADHWGLMCGFPIRAPAGHLFYPLSGSGTYWSVEIEAARELGHSVEIGEGWAYRRRCDCATFAWVPELYERRAGFLAAGELGPGRLLKGALAALYGKLAQVRHAGPYGNPIWAGLVTAKTRAAVARALAQAGQGEVIMVATDAIYARRELAGLDLGEGLGQWGHKLWPSGLFAVQPGFYWRPGAAADAETRGSRGFSGARFFEGRDERGAYWTDVFEGAWATYLELIALGCKCRPPTLDMPIPGFVGLKLAHARKKPELAGRWVEETRALSFKWNAKRDGQKVEGGAIVTRPKIGGVATVSWRDAAEAGERWQLERERTDEQPDYVDAGAPWSDE
jgi:hypothetical protein